MKSIKELSIGDVVWYRCPGKKGHYEGTIKDIQELGDNQFKVVFPFQVELIFDGDFVLEPAPKRELEWALSQSQLEKPKTYKGVSLE